MSCDKCAKQCDNVATAAGIPQLDAEWSAGGRKAEHCPKCGGWLTEDRVCNSTRHNWVSQLDQEARLYGTTAQDVLDQDPRFDDPAYVPSGAPGAYMAQVGRDLLADDNDTPNTRDTLEALVDEYEDFAGDTAANDPVYLEAIKTLNRDSATETEVRAAMENLSGVYRKKKDPDFESDALSQADEILSAAKVRRTNIAAAPAALRATSPADTLRRQMQKQLASLEEQKDNPWVVYPQKAAQDALNAQDLTPRKAWNTLYTLNHIRGITGPERLETPETAGSDRVLAKTGAELWAEPLSEEAYKDVFEAEAASRWMTDLARQKDDPDTALATAAVRHVIGFADGKRFQRDSLEVDDAARLMRHTDWSQIGAKDTGRFFETFYGITDTGSKEEAAVMNAMLHNPTTPPELLNNRLTGFADNFKPDQVDALVNHPHFGKTGQEKLMYSPKMTTRKTLATSANTHPDILKEMVKDPNRQVALSAIRNSNQPLAPAVEAGRKSGLSDTQLVTQIQQKTRTWRDTPRCSVCGAWTKPDGVCRNARCGAENRKTAEAKRWPPVGAQQNLGVEVPGSVHHSLNNGYSKSAQYRTIRENWADAMQSKKPLPKEWRGAITEGVERLAAMGEYDLGEDKVLAWNEKYGAYTLNGIPVPADNAGQAVRTALKTLNTDGQAYRAIESMGRMLENNSVILGDNEIPLKTLNFGGDKVLRLSGGDDKTAGTFTIFDLASGKETVIGQMPPQKDAGGHYINFGERGEATRNAVKQFLAENGNPPLYRYSDGHGKMVVQGTPEPVRFKAAAPITGEVTDKPLPLKLAGTFEKGAVIRPGISKFDHKRYSVSVTLHNAGSQGYVNFKPDDALTLPAAEVKGAVEALGNFTTIDNARPQLSSVWGFSQADRAMSTPQQYGFNPKTNYWIATDGFRLTMVAGGGDTPIPSGGVTLHSETAKLAAGSGDFHFGVKDTTSGHVVSSFQTKDGYRAEATTDTSRKFPDVHQVIPTKQQTADWPAFEITQKVPKELLGANSAKIAEMYHKDGSLYMRIRDDRNKDNEVTHDIAVGKLTGQNHYPDQEGEILSGVNMQYFNEMVDLNPGKKGTWTLRMQGRPEYQKSAYNQTMYRDLKPMVFTHSTDEAFGILMPMHLGG